MLIAQRKKRLKKKLDNRLKKVEREFVKLNGEKVLKMQGRKNNYLADLEAAYLKVCTKTTPYVKIS